MTKIEMKHCKKFNPFWIMTVVNATCRRSYKTQNSICQNTKTFSIPNIDAKVIPFIDGSWDKSIFEKTVFYTKERKISCCPDSMKCFCQKHLRKIGWTLVFKILTVIAEFSITLPLTE